LQRSPWWSWLVVATLTLQCGCGEVVLPPPAPKASTTVLRPVPPRPPQDEESAADLFARIQGMMGAPPMECGRHFLIRTGNGFKSAGANELELSLKCGMAAAQVLKPFWTFKQNHGIDSWVADGLLGGTDGILQRFWYDSAPCGGPGCEARLRLGPCERPSVVTARDGNAEFACGTTRP
jgi:hypothetical protein